MIHRTLSTFRWDIIDPGDSPVASAKMETPREKQQENSSIDAGELSSNRAILDGVKLPVGRGPLRPTRGSSSIRGEGRPSLLQKQNVTPSQPSGLRFSSTMESDFARGTKLEISYNTEELPNHRLEGINSTPPASRRGRPPKVDSSTVQHIKQLPKRIGRPPKALSGEIGARGSIAGRKVGRPRMHPLAQSKPMGRPRKLDPKLVTPKFIPFLCEWKDCKAELHNLETLRRHVYTVHTNPQDSESIPCRWSRCGLTRQVPDMLTPNVTVRSTPEPKFVHEPHMFGGMQKFKYHMEKAHLIPFAWHMGDGPRGSTLDGSESNSSAYLSDAAGNEITPSIASQATERPNGRAKKARRLIQPERHRLFDPALESPVELATPSMRANFYMGTEWKVIKAPPREEWGF